MEWLKTYILFAGVSIAIATLIDWIISKDEEKKCRSYLFNWWYYFERFNYRRTIKKANIRCNRLLNSIYGKKHFSLRCFGASTLISISFAILIGLIVFSSDTFFIFIEKSFYQKSMFFYSMVAPPYNCTL